MDMGMKMDQITERLHRADHGRNAAVAVDLKLEDSADRIVGRPTELTQQFSIIPEVNPQSLGYRKYPLPVWYDGKDLVLEPEGKQ
jgi:hypothetical protein